MTLQVIHDNDGHVDDLLSTMLLWLAPDVEVQAVTVSDGDCYVTQSYESLIKIATFLEVEGGEIGMSEDQVPNPFPDNWRKESYIINELPIFSDNELKMAYQTKRPRKSAALITDCLQNTKKPVTLVCTGPLTNVAPVFEEHPELRDKVENCVLMGGAISVPGNVEMPDHDGSAEWNFYADPGAAKRFFDSGVPITLVPLDATNRVPVTREFILRLDEQADKFRASQLAAKMYSLVKGFNYYFWDTLTAAVVLRPELVSFKEQRLDIIPSGKSAGKSVAPLFGGRKCKVATTVDVDKFETLLLEILRLK